MKRPMRRSVGPRAAALFAASRRMPNAARRSRSTTRPSPRFSLRWPLIGLLLLIAGISGLMGLQTSRQPQQPLQAASAPLPPGTVEVEGVRFRPIETYRLGQRTAGRNPLRHEVDDSLSEPDPATWREVRLRMTKANGLLLRIELLRPLEWFEAAGAQVGTEVYLELPEMGAVGAAAVTYIGPCPVSQPGPGNVVTGTFKHQADENSNVVHLELEGQIELTGVTANHAYWSVDRQTFIEVCSLRIGELVDTEYGAKHAVSVTPIDYTGFLYNLETTEHVYRVGSLGTLVHNSCALTRYGDDFGHHIFSRRAFEGLPNYRVNDALAIGNTELSRLGLKHLGSNSLSTTQQRLFRELAARRQPNILAQHARIARQTLIEHGISRKEARRIVEQAAKQLKSWGITSPVHLPWGGY